MTLTASPDTLATDRLRLRPWRAEDRAPFAGLNADPAVMEFFPAPLDRVASDALADRIEAHFARHGFGLWAVELPGTAPFIGFVGLSVPRVTTHFTPCVEIAWRLARAHWGRGYASEGACRVLAHGFDALALPEIVAFTVPANRRSRAVMQRIGMRHDADGEFDHPGVPDGHQLRRHVLYRMTANELRRD